MSSLVSYSQAGDVATLVMDDGKGNAVSPDMVQALHSALDRAEADGARVVVLAGRPGVFSAGFHLATLMAGDDRSLKLLEGGFQLARRLMSLGQLVVVAATGHTIAMGLFLALCGDVVVGPSDGVAKAGQAEKPFKVVANEVEMGIPVPRPALDILRMRLTPADAARAALTSSCFSPEEAVKAGIFDRLAPHREVLRMAEEIAQELAERLKEDALATTKARLRKDAIERVRGHIDEDITELRAMM